jgi:hypothetical protein
VGQSKIDRTNEFETAVKTLIFESQTAEEIQIIAENLQQKKFDRLIKRGIIRINERLQTGNDSLSML